MLSKTHLALTFIREIVFALPGVIEKILFDTPAFYVNKNIFARLKEDEENLVIHTVEREKWMFKALETFFITDHYLKYKYMLINLDRVDPSDLKYLLLTAYKNRATKKQVSLLTDFID
jgi:hypothetical protein